MADKKTVGQLREEDRYHGNPHPGGNQQARARMFIDHSFTPDEKYMDESVKDTSEIVRKSAQAGIDAQAKKAYPKSFKRGGMVKKSGMAHVHKGEKVLTRSQAKKSKMH